ncbi:MAG: hypothetical protein OEW91_14660, partial [Acidimicrobiia bacterium]|nr:hypothetical protein [Acidimicrobiia bacterium]
QVAAVYETIPPEDRAGTVILTGSYGQAGAIELLGPDAGLPSPVSGHNNYWLWGPPTGDGPIIGVGPLGSVLEPICPTLRPVGVISNPWNLPNEELGTPLLLCLNPVAPLADIWDSVRHYN